MLDEFIFLTLKNIQDSDSFFKVINRGISPVHVKLPNNQLLDLRHNLALQNYITFNSPYSTIDCIELYLMNEGDANQLIQLFG